MSVEGNFAKTVEFIAKNGLWEKFDKRLQQCVSWASVCGYGFADGIDDIYEEVRHRIGLSGNLVGISINLCKSIQKELFINDAP